MPSARCDKHRGCFLKRSNRRYAWASCWCGAARRRGAGGAGCRPSRPSRYPRSGAGADRRLLRDRRGDAAEPLVEALHEAYPDHREVKKRLARVEVGHGRYVSARRLWAEVTCHDRRISGPPLHLERLDSRPIPAPAGEIRLFTRLRNEAVRLPWLFDFYRRQGVDRFFVVDNGSDDGSRDWLLAQPDTHCSSPRTPTPSTAAGSAGSTIC